MQQEIPNEKGKYQGLHSVSQTTNEEEMRAGN
jgi:hypothetical protein